MKIPYLQDLPLSAIRRQIRRRNGILDSALLTPRQRLEIISRIMPLYWMERLYLFANVLQHRGSEPTGLSPATPNLLPA